MLFSGIDQAWQVSLRTSLDHHRIILADKPAKCNRQNVMVDLPSMFEVSDPGENHGQIELIGRLDNLLVSD